MKKTKISLTLLSLLAGIIIVLACAGGYEFEFGSSQFAPESITNKAYSPFFYSYEYYYGIYYDDKHNSRFNEEIVNDWHTYFTKKYTKSDIKDLLITSNALHIDSAIKKRTPAFLANNGLLKNQTDKQVQSFLQFLSASKSCESFVLNNPGEWGYYGDEKPKPRKSSKDIVQKLATAYAAQKDYFLETRYWFQWLRACYFNEDYAGAIQVFEKGRSYDKTSLYYRAMAYCAGAYYKQKKYAQSNYLYSIVYDKCDALKTTAHFSFHPQQESDWQATLALCKTNEEKITLWQMLGIFYKDELRSMNEIIKLNPNSEKLDVLLARYINKVENNKLGSNEYGNAYSLNTSELQSILTSQLTGKVNALWKWQMALAYLQTLDKKYNEANVQLTEAKKTLPSDALIQAQWRQLKLILEISRLTKIDAATENRLLPELEWITKVVADTSFKTLRSNYTNNWMHLHMADVYRQQKDSAKAEYFSVLSQFYASDKNCEQIKSFLKKPTKTPYEQFCEKQYVYTFEDIVEYQAIKAFYDEKLDESIAFMTQAGENAESKLKSNPFNGGIKDCHDCDHALPQKTVYTKLGTLKKMKEMQTALTLDTYNNALLLANAFYNMTYFGSSRAFYECDIVGRGYQYPGNADKKLYDQLLSMTLARKYYTMALKAATSDEQRAKCQYMLAKCERNDWGESRTEKNGKTIDFVAWDGFKNLKTLSNTKYYKEVIKECGYFKTYIGKSR